MLGRRENTFVHVVPECKNWLGENFDFLFSSDCSNSDPTEIKTLIQTGKSNCGRILNKKRNKQDALSLAYKSNIEWTRNIWNNWKVARKVLSQKMDGWQILKLKKLG